MSNPFQALRARLEAEAKKQAPSVDGKKQPPKTSGAAGSRRSSPPPPAPKSAPKSAANVDEDDDAALFLNSVAAVPLQKGPRVLPGASSGGVPMPPLTQATTGPSTAKTLSDTGPTAMSKTPAQATVSAGTDGSGKAAPPNPSAGTPASHATAGGGSLPPGTTGISATGDAHAPSEEALFHNAMLGVAPVSAKGRNVHTPAEPPSCPPGQDPAAALRDLLDGKLEFAVCHTDEYLEGFVAGLDPLVLAKLRAGAFSPEGHLDLHGQNAHQALDSLIIFMKNAYRRSLRTVLIITGRGRNSPDGIGILRLQLQQWLTQDPFKRVVLAFCTAQTADGGPGAVYVLLRKYKKNRGKIVWERGPGDDDDYLM